LLAQTKANEKLKLKNEKRQFKIKNYLLPNLLIIWF